MRKFGIVLMALLCMSFAIPALAAEKGEMMFGLNGGVGIPLSDFGKAYKMGFTGGVFGDYTLTPMFAIGVDASYSQFKGKDLPIEFRDDAGDLVFGITEAKVTPIQFGAHVKVMPAMANMPFMPYAQVGAGIYSVKGQVTTASDLFPQFAGTSDETKSKFGWNIGIGADYKVTPQVGLGVFGTYHNITDAFLKESFDATTGETTSEKKSASYVTVGLKLTFSTAAVTSATK